MLQVYSELASPHERSTRCFTMPVSFTGFTDSGHLVFNKIYEMPSFPLKYMRKRSLGLREIGYVCMDR